MHCFNRECVLSETYWVSRILVAESFKRVSLTQWYWRYRRSEESLDKTIIARLIRSAPSFLEFFPRGHSRVVVDEEERRSPRRYHITTYYTIRLQVRGKREKKKPNIRLAVCLPGPRRQRWSKHWIINNNWGGCYITCYFHTPLSFNHHYHSIVLLLFSSFGLDTLQLRCCRSRERPL